jgi:hypothetical protein
MNEQTVSLLQEIETFLRQMARIQIEDLEREAANIHDAAQILAEALEAVLEEVGDD